MPTQTWTLFDQMSGRHVGHSFDVLGEDGRSRVQLQIGKSGLSQGVEQIVIDNGKLRLVLLPTRGMSLWKAWYHGTERVTRETKGDGSGNNKEEMIGWESPVRGPVHPAFVPLGEPSGLGWLDGFDELLVRCGLESNGSPEFKGGNLLYPLHGRIGNKPAWKAEVTLDYDAGEMLIRGWVEESRFHIFKVSLETTIRTKFNSSSIDITDVVTNLSATPAEIQMLYHLNLGRPLLDPGAQVLAPIDKLVPRNAHAAGDVANWSHYAGATPGYEEMVYFARLYGDGEGRSCAVLKNAHGTRGLMVRFNTRELPCLSIWKNTSAEEDGYVTGIEPGTNFPNPRSFEGNHGRIVPLAGRASTRFHLGIDYLIDEGQVAAGEATVRQLQLAPPNIVDEPQPDWCHT